MLKMSIFILILFLTTLSDGWAWERISVSSSSIVKYKSNLIYDSLMAAIDKNDSSFFILSGVGPKLETMVTDKIDITPFLKPKYNIKIFKISKNKIVKTIFLKKKSDPYLGIPLNNSVDSRIKGTFQPVAVTEDLNILPSNKMGLLPIDFIAFRSFFLVLDGYGPRLMVFNREGEFQDEYYLNSENRLKSKNSKILARKGFEINCVPISIKRYRNDAMAVITKCENEKIFSIVLNENFQFLSKRELKNFKESFNYFANCEDTFYYSDKKGDVYMLKDNDKKVTLSLKDKNITFGCLKNELSAVLERVDTLECSDSKCNGQESIKFWQN